MEILPDASPALVTAMLSEQENYLTTFTTLLIKEEEKQKEEGQAPDNLINDTTCK